MREVIEGKLWTGNSQEARDSELLYRLGICAVVDLAIEEPPAATPRELAYLRCPFDDAESASREMLQLAIETASSLVKRGVPTLIACSAGLSRSPSVAAAAVSLHSGQTLHAALADLSRHGPTDVSPGLLKTVASVFEQMVS